MLVSVVINTTLALAKVLGGIFGHSHALIADGIESSLDILTSALLWGAIKYSEKPPDSDHPYGHGKMESLAAVAGSLALIAAGLAFGVHSVSGLIHLSSSPAGEPLPAFFTLIIVGVTIVTKEFLFRWLYRRGQEIGSKAVMTDAWHHRSDAMTSLAALVGITAALIGGPSWAQADEWAALFSCGLIVFNGLQMLRNAAGDILDEQASSDLTSNILAKVSEVPGVTSMEKIRVRRSGLMYIADLHVRVAGNRTVREGHEIAHLVKDHLLAADFQLSDVTVHIEPEDGSDVCRIK